MSVNNNYLISKITHSQPFYSEENLIISVLEHIHHFLPADNIVTLTELRVGAGRVDIVAGQVRSVSQSICSNLTNLEACVLSHLYYRKRLKALTVSNKLGLALSQVTDCLEKLCLKGYCVQAGQCFVRNQLPITNVVAIEGKLQNWRKALTQASRNRLFTSQSFVALDARYARPAIKNLQLFRNAKVGLAIVFNDDEIHILHRPPHRPPIADILPVMAESALIAHITH
ncbi:MAG: hypothetical protein AAFR81_30435 [Chloroflexota bacterium]